MTLFDPDRPAAAPRPAATVVLLREGPRGEPQVFMLRRSAKSPFMPDALVFPGGAVDAADGPAGSDEAYEAAARRECHEEAGVALAGPLRWFDTWVTPSAEPRRYCARFYLAELTGDEGEGATADGHETHDGRWATPAEILAAWDREEVDLPPPTLCTLLRLADARRAGLSTLPADAVREPILPKGLLAAGPEGDARLVVVLPHDPDYATAIGDGAPAPPRIADLPPRLVRAGKVWRPC